MQRQSPRFALLSYDGTDNIGDEIQGLAARRFLPSVDAHVNRDKVNDHIDSKDPLFIIMNGWHCHSPENWPPSGRLIPLLISIHIAPYPVGRSRLVPSQHLLSGANLEYFRTWGPVGTRDKNTLKLMKAAGVEAYFSGCLTLTLPKLDIQKQDHAIACDIPDELVMSIRSRCRTKIECVSHVGYNHLNQDTRFQKADELLRYYASAKCVITTRIHCALPCLAMGVPVLFVNNGQDGGRFWGLIEFVNNCSIDDVRNQRINYDIDSPPPNPTHFVPSRDALIEKAGTFIELAKSDRVFAR